MKTKIKNLITFNFFIPKPYRVHIIYWLIIFNLFIFHQLYDKYREFEQFIVTKSSTASLLAVGREEFRPISRVMASEDDNHRGTTIGNDRGDGRVYEISVGAKGSLAERNNNPGNLRYAFQEGSVRGESGFARFGSNEKGYDALLKQIRLDQRRGHTIKSFLNKYAPNGDWNDTSLYIKIMTDGLKCGKNDKLSGFDAEAIADIIISVESNSKRTWSKI